MRKLPTILATHEQDFGGRFHVRPDRIGAGEMDEQFVAGHGEVGRQHQRCLGRIQVVDRQYPESACRFQPFAPFGCVERGVPGVDEHVNQSPLPEPVTAAM